MMVRKGLVTAAAAVLALGSAAWADDSNAVSAQSATDAKQVTSALVATHTGGQPIMADDAAATPAPLMNGLGKTPIGKPLNDAGLNVYGYVEGGYMYDFTVPRDVSPPKTAPSNGILFIGPYKNSPKLDQVDLTIERLVDPTKGKFDVGGRIEGIFGTDATFVHSNGILDNSVKHGAGGFSQLDLEQAYITVAIPTSNGQGLLLKAGKFVTLMGYESINPTANPLFTHAYSFSYAIPFTQTGVLAQYIFNSNLNVIGGFTRGWNQSTLDNNGAIDFLGQVNYTINDKWSITGNLSVGPEATKDNGDYWFVPEGILTYKMSDQLTLTADTVYGFANALAQWYGVAAYANYKLNNMFAFNGRGEYYHDGKGFTTGFGGTDLNFYEVTAGVAITPLPDNEWFKTLTIRPEVRYDWAEHGVFDTGKFSQLTAAVDAYWQF
ncbi:MAG: porin [Planctomycetota bacterium]|nr:porin [Planctomycetota bacterium]